MKDNPLLRFLNNYNCTTEFVPIIIIKFARNKLCGIILTLRNYFVWSCSYHMVVQLSYGPAIMQLLFDLIIL